MPTKLLSPEQATCWLDRRYGNQHRAWLAGQGEWPLNVGLGVPAERDVAEDAAAVRAWVEAWAKWKGPGEVAWGERKWPRLGTQRLPVSLSFSSASDVAACIGQGERWALAAARYAAFYERWPQLQERPGLERHFNTLADYGDEDFGRLTSALAWLLDNPRSGHFVRQLPIFGLDTKWLEKRTGLIVDLVKLLSGSDESGDFYEVCGLRRPAHRIRVRLLCSTLRRAVGGLRDIEVPVEDLAALDVGPQAILIVENLETGMALPDMPGVAAFMKLGNAVSALGAVQWLQELPAIYWGDLDTHGLAILGRARQVLPRLRSVLMDEPTLIANRALWSQEPSQHPDADLLALTQDERSVFQGLRAHRWGVNVRLEQERLPWTSSIGLVRAALAEASGLPGP